MTILVAEDDPNFRGVLREALELQGHTVVSAENGRMAFELLQQYPVHLVVSNVHMPECSGTQLHQKIGSDHRSCALPFVYIAGYSILRVSTPLDSSGLDFMLNRVTFDRLLHVVNELGRTYGIVTEDGVLMNVS